MNPALDSLATCERIDLMVGVEANLYFEGLLPRSITEEWEPFISCELGEHRADRWRLLPEESQIGRHPFLLSLKDPRDDHRYTFASELHIHGPTKNLHPQQWLPVGDSITATGLYVEALCKRSEQCGPLVQSVGTRTGTQAPSIRHEGYPGWKYLDFLRKRPATPGPNFREEIDPPFLSSSSSGECLDFAAYRQTHLADEEPDFITLFLGANDVALLDDTKLDEEIPKIVEQAVTLANAFLQDTSQSRIGLIPPLPPAASQDAFGINYGCQIPRWRYRKNQHALLRALQIQFERFHPRLSLIPAFLHIDPVTGYPMRNEPANGHSDVIRSVACNAVHPSPSGYNQIADAILAWIAGQTHLQPLPGVRSNSAAEKTLSTLPPPMRKPLET